MSTTEMASHSMLFCCSVAPEPEMSNDTHKEKRTECYMCKYLDTDYIILSYKYRLMRFVRLRRKRREEREQKEIVSELCDTLRA